MAFRLVCRTEKYTYADLNNIYIYIYIYINTYLVFLHTHKLMCKNVVWGWNVFWPWPPEPRKANWQAGPAVFCIGPGYLRSRNSGILGC